MALFYLGLSDLQKFIPEVAIKFALSSLQISITEKTYSELQSWKMSSLISLEISFAI